VEKGAIRYGLLGVKNIGEKAIESIVQAREEKGPVASLADLCERADTRAVNKKVLEYLIKCGALDSLKIKRSQQFALLDQAMDASARRQKEKGAGQLSFFDVFGGAGAKPVAAAGASELEEWPQEQLLAFEKQLLGFYLTGHPLDAYRTILQLLGPANAADLASFKDGASVTLGGVIAHLKVTTTKRGNERMAIVRFEDFTGDAEVLIFPKIFPLIESNLKPDAVVMVRVKVSAREARPRVLADEIIPLEEAWNRQVSGRRIRLEGTTERKVLEELKLALGKSPGRVPVELSVGSGGNGGGVRIAVGSTLQVNPSLGLIQTLVKLVGPEAISIRR
jgi:DNA polymerase-3 subunit alpha